MNHAVKRKNTSGRWLMWLLVLAGMLILGALAATSVRIIQTARKSELHAADAIVVFGAAQYDGRPSPVFRARLDHAYDLFQEKLAPVVITTGGAGNDPKYSEGGVGRDYLIGRGIPEGDLIAETQGSDSARSAERVAVIMRTNDLHSCVAVSDAYHLFRIQQMLEREGLTVYVAPRPWSRPPTKWERVQAIGREATSYLVWRVGL
jgi:uncharacterized SAM-binding protein YcdF (DUF218 family)